MTIATPRTIAELLNIGLFGSAIRIRSAFRLKLLGEASGAVPPDVAAVTTELRHREIASFGSIISSIVPYEEEINALYTRKRTSSMPKLEAGESVLDPLRYQHSLLVNAPVIENSWLWLDMPENLYLSNRLADADQQTRTILQDLGFVEAAELGSNAYIEDPDKVAAAKSSLAQLEGMRPFGSKMHPAGWLISGVVSVATLVGVAAGGLALYEWASSREAVAQIAREEADNARRHQEALILAEHDGALLQACLNRTQAAGLSEEECLSYRERMREWPQQAAPSALPRKCGTRQCWPWAAGSVMVGLLLGHAIVRKLGLTER